MIPIDSIATQVAELIRFERMDAQSTSGGLVNRWITTTFLQLQQIGVRVNSVLLKDRRQSLHLNNSFFVYL